MRGWFFMNYPLYLIKEIKGMMTEKEYYFLLRRKKKISQKEISQEIGVTQSLISRYETGDCEMSEQKIERYRSYIDQK